jgi:hypothetical protein
MKTKISEKQNKKNRELILKHLILREKEKKKYKSEDELLNACFKK